MPERLPVDSRAEASRRFQALKILLFVSLINLNFNISNIGSYCCWFTAKAFRCESRRVLTRRKWWNVNARKKGISKNGKRTSHCVGTAVRGRHENDVRMRWGSTCRVVYGKRSTIKKSVRKWIVNAFVALRVCVWECEGREGLQIFHFSVRFLLHHISKTMGEPTSGAQTMLTQDCNFMNTFPQLIRVSKQIEQQFSALLIVPNITKTRSRRLHQKKRRRREDSLNFSKMKME